MAHTTLGATGLTSMPEPTIQEGDDPAVAIVGFIRAHAARSGITFEEAALQLIALAPLANRDRYRKALERARKS